MKKKFWTLGLVIYIIYARLLVFVRLCKPSSMSAKITQILYKACGEKFIIEQIPKISLIPFTIHFDIIKWDKGEEGELSTLFTVKNSYIEMQFTSLLSSKIIINQIVLDSPTINIAQNSSWSKSQSIIYNLNSIFSLPLVISKIEMTNAQIYIEHINCSTIKISNANIIINDFAYDSIVSIEAKMLMEIEKYNLQTELHLCTQATINEKTICLDNINLRYTSKGEADDKNKYFFESKSNLQFNFNENICISGKINIDEITLEDLFIQYNKIQGLHALKTNLEPSIYPELDLKLEIDCIKLYDINCHKFILQINSDDKSNGKYYFDLVQMDCAYFDIIKAKASIELPSMLMRNEGVINNLNLKPLLNALQFSTSMDTTLDLHWELAMLAVSNKDIVETMRGVVMVHSNEIFFQDGIAIPTNPITKPIYFHEFTNLTLPLQIANGNAQIDGSTLEGKSVTMYGAGIISLLQQKLDLKLDVKTLNTIIPINITGFIYNPICVVDPIWIAKALVNLPTTLLKQGVNAGIGANKILYDVGKGAGRLIKGIFK